MLGSSRVGNIDGSEQRERKRHKKRLSICALPPDRKLKKQNSLSQMILNTSLRTVLPEQNSNSEQPTFIKINVGGMSYRLKSKTLQMRPDMGFLYRFSSISHGFRIELCDGYIEETNEYYFERSPHLFEAIYQLYLTEELHIPTALCLDCSKSTSACLELFYHELKYWDISEALLDCCGPTLATKSFTSSDSPEIDEFDGIRMGFLRRHIWNLIEVPESSLFARVFSFISVVAVLLSNGSLVLGSLKSFQLNFTKFVDDEFGGRFVTYNEPLDIFQYIEYACISWFSIEYIGKVGATPNRKETVLHFMNIIDLIAIIPFYIEMTVTLAGLDAADLQDFKGALLVVRILRVLRVIRLFKLGRYSTGLQTFAKTLQKSKEQLGMLIVVLATGVMFFSTLMYFLEKDVEGTAFTSIPAAFWWCIVTMTTVGYGDVVPTSIGGKLVASCAITAGVLVLALPITIVVDNFMQIQAEEHQQKKDAGIDDGIVEGVGFIGRAMKAKSSMMHD